MSAPLDFAIGDPVAIVGRVVGRSEFEEGPKSYMVEYERRGKPCREWFMADDMELDIGSEEGPEEGE